MGGGGRQCVKGPADVGLDPDLDVIVGINLGGDPAHVDDPLVAFRVDPHRIELLELVADADDHVRLVKTEVYVVVTHESHRTEAVRMIVGEHPFAVKGRGNREAQQFGEAPQGLGRTAPSRTVPGQDDGTAGPVEHGGGTGNLRR